MYNFKKQKFIDMDKNNKRKNLTFGEKKEICEWKN